LVRPAQSPTASTISSCSLKYRKFKSEVHLVHLGQEPDGQRQGELSQRIEDLIVQADEQNYEEGPDNLV